MDPFLIATGIVTLAEMGDKTQLLALALTVRYRRPLPIICGVLVATLLNHAGAGAVGTLLSDLINPQVLNWLAVASFAVIGAWILVPDKRAGQGGGEPTGRYGVFGTTLIAFFIAEMGDKTQIATVALAARFHDFPAVVAGTTLGMMLANVPAILLGNRFADRLPASALRLVTAIAFVVLGGLALVQALQGVTPGHASG
jgi:putative Ca2+/H+ antiporter (TMEM165/GDT1 family)